MNDNDKWIVYMLADFRRRKQMEIIDPDKYIKIMVEAYRDSPPLDKEKYLKQMLGPWKYFWFKVKRFFKRLIK